ncbi:MAG: diguanylate cyclase [Rhodocyclaceae bacterium]|nr:MAG: diguanylate cyclase [Rhodocyclaceae bacterium]
MRSGALLLLLALVLSFPAKAGEAVILQLKWKHQFQFAGYYMALEKGYYQSAGLDVAIREADGDINPITEVLTGRAQYAVAGPELAMVRAQGQPVVALAAIIQHSPLILLTRSNIASVQDLEGKRVMLMPYETELFAYLKREGLTSAQIQALPHSFNYEDLIHDKTDAISGYSTDEPYDLKAMKFPFNQFSPRSAGIDFYGDTLFTSDDYLRDHAAQVAAFREASLKGWRYAVDHPEEAATLIRAKYSQRHSKAHLLNEAAEIVHLMYPDLVEIGHMSPGRWRHIADIYAEVGLIPAGSSIDGLIYDAHEAIIPRWISRTLVAGLLLLLILSYAAFRFHRINRRLATTLEERDQAMARLAVSEERFRTLLDKAPVAVMAWSEGYLVREWNHAAEYTFGWTREEILGRNFMELMVRPEDRRQVDLDIRATLRSQDDSRRRSHINLTKDGREILCSWSNTDCHDAQGGPLGTISIAQDVTAQTRMADALRESERRYRTLLEIAPFPVMVTRIADGGVIFCNHRASERLGLRSDNLEGLYAPKFWEKPEQRQEMIARLVERGFVFDYEVQLHTLKGVTFWAHLSAILIAKPDGASEAFVSFNDITERKNAELALHQSNMNLQMRLVEIQELQQQLQEQAVRDSLTGLYNRRYLAETLDRELARARRQGHPLSLLLIDLDHFKELNDNHGHRAGDAVLKAVAELLRMDIRSADLACRYGGEEFLIVLPGMGLDKAEEKAESWRQSIEGHLFKVREETLRITASFGVAVYPEHGRDPDQLIHAADTALYEAKRQGRNRVICAGSAILA